MVREPNESELNYINKYLSKKELQAEDIYMLDATVANDFMITQYSYFLGATSLHNFVNDLNDMENPQKFLINHSAGIPMGTWLGGSLGKVLEGYVVEAPVYMLKGLDSGGQTTDDIIKAFEAGHLTDVSVSWEDGDPMCDMCDLDIRDPECPHIPGVEYEGKMSTCTIENAHLAGEISGVWKGALPGAKFKGKMSRGRKKDTATLNWKKLKKTGLSGELSHKLTVPINLFESLQQEEDMTFKDVKAKFKKELAEEYVLKTEHETALAEVVNEKDSFSTTIEELTKDNETVTEEMEKLTKEHGELVKSFANLNAEADENKELVQIGAAHIEGKTAEYHKCGVSLHGDKWDREVKDTSLKALNDNEKIKFLKAEIELMTEELSKKELGQHSKGGDDKDKKVYTHRDNDELYTMRRL